MSALNNPSLSDPLCLEGLEPLLDQIFAVPNSVADFAPDADSEVRTSNLRFLGGHEEFYSVEPQPEEVRNQLLTKQLNELKSELKEFQFRYRHLELRNAVYHDQLQYMPELFSKVLELTAVQSENIALKQENAALLNTIEHMKPKDNSPSMGRRILNRFFGL